MSGRLFRWCIAVVAAIVVFVGVTPSAVTAAPAAVSWSDIATECAGKPVRVAARWYFPPGEPSAIVWLQHGFSRTAANLDAMARAYAKAGFLVVSPTLDSVNLGGCAVAYNIADNAAFARTIGGVFGAGRDRGSPLATSLRKARDSAHRPDVTMPYRMIFSGHSAGGEFVVVAADALRRADPVAYRRLAGLMLFDPVNSFFGVNFATAAASLSAAGLQIRVIASQPSVSNNFGQGVSVLQETTRQEFLGSRLVTGIHIDAEGESTDLIGELSELAVPRPRNGRVIRALATGWSSDMVADTATPTYYPGGRYYDLLLKTRTVTTLPVP
ncbi:MULTISPECIES: alpha/beta hydrolase [unclassified Gordonia (in: high G+C Gram-positive bacteria)]|uniref:alpha/beta hydrolase n=1 Tax=unclassified Gordonia (in: high G+C Gram-positive bacteria) TaxID=2657482 RepID=UPI0010F88828|nr:MULTISPECIES: alpha/beta hydrolase [unclassified Gordonia (in: high G+C Gram-positive bacteria)]MBR7191502.1 alpha/beta hydrolase [Gordonia sp. SCSIO 19800]